MVQLWDRALFWTASITGRYGRLDCRAQKLAQYSLCFALPRLLLALRQNSAGPLLLFRTVLVCDRADVQTRSGGIARSHAAPRLLAFDSAAVVCVRPWEK